MDLLVSGRTKTMLLGNGRAIFARTSYLLVAAALFCFGAGGQETETRRPTRDEPTSRRVLEPADLAKDNFDRVAASPEQLRAVLARDAGILVELKRWVAKEATDNGQVVDDFSLSESAIFERLDRDMQFRSVATRLVQRYGYLLPTINPDSSAAKEEDLVL